MAYTAPKKILDDYLAALRGYGVGMLKSVDDAGACVFRKGPQTSFRRGEDVETVVVVAWRGMPEGEKSAGSGNVWNHTCDLAVTLIVPYDPDAPEASYDKHLDLTEDFFTFQAQMEQRHLSGDAQVGHIKSAEAFVDSFFPSFPDDLYHITACLVSYRTRKGGG